MQFLKFTKQNGGIVVLSAEAIASAEPAGGGNSTLTLTNGAQFVVQAGLKQIMHGIANGGAVVDIDAVVVP